MAGLTHSIGGVNFDELSHAADRYSLGCFSFSRLIDIKRFHAPGSNGNFVMHCGRTGGKIIARLRYLDTLGNVLAAYQSDHKAWEDTPVTIVTSDNESITRCLLSAGGMSPKGEPTAFGRSNFVVMDAVAAFDIDS